MDKGQGDEGVIFQLCASRRRSIAFCLMPTEERERVRWKRCVFPRNKKKQQKKNFFLFFCKNFTFSFYN